MLPPQSEALSDPDLSVVPMAVLGSGLAGLASGLGAAGVFLVRRISEYGENMLLSVAAGIMLAATFFSLILPGLEDAEVRFGGPVAAVAVVSAGILAGAAALWWLHDRVPHEHFVLGREGPDRDLAAERRIWLFVIAITLHNLPEGMAVGVGFSTGDLDKGLSLATGIGLQNVPEGLAVASALITIGYTRTCAFLVATLSGLVEPLGGFLASIAVTIAAPLLPATLGLAAGAMLFIISDEIIPETHRKGVEAHATMALIVGFLVMMALDFTLA